MTNTTTIKKATVQMARKFCQTQLEQKQKEARETILTGKYTYHKSAGHGYWSYPAVESFSFTSFQLVIEFVHKMATEGRELSAIEKPFAQGTFFKVSFLKSKEELEILFAESDALVAAEYAKQIEDHNTAQIELLTTQLYNQAKAKEEKVIADKEAKALAAAKSEAEKFITSQLEGAK